MLSFREHLSKEDRAENGMNYIKVNNHVVRIRLRNDGVEKEGATHSTVGRFPRAVLGSATR
jgi:hypothetical protein